MPRSSPAKKQQSSNEQIAKRSKAILERYRRSEELRKKEGITPYRTSKLAREYHSKLLPKVGPARQRIRLLEYRVMIAEGEARNAWRANWATNSYLSYLRAHGKIKEQGWVPMSPSYSPSAPAPPPASSSSAKKEEEEDDNCPPFRYPEHRDYVQEAGFYQVYGPGEFSPGYDPTRCMYTMGACNPRRDSLIVFHMPEPSPLLEKNRPESPPPLSLE